MKDNIFKSKAFGISTGAVVLAAVTAGFFAYNSRENELPDISHGEAQIITEPAAVTEPPVTANANAAVTGLPAETDISAAVTVPDEKLDAEEAAAPAPAQPMVRPINGEIIGEFSNGELVKSNTLNVWKTHDGVDIKADQGSTVKSMSTGTVQEVKEDPMWGVCVTIDHGNGIEAYYCGLEKTVPVKAGDTVSAGTVIGTVGNTAEAEIAEVSHLHFGVKKNGSWVDPSSVIGSIGS